LIPSYSGTTITRVTPQSEQLSMPMSHISGQIPAAALSVCANCHASGAIYPGAFHSSLNNLMLAQPGACSDCHQSSAPTGFGGLTDCQQCHASSTTAWTGGRFHVTARPSTCVACHENERPATLAAFSGPPFDFATNAAGITHGAGQDCAGCHASTTAWTGGNF